MCDVKEHVLQHQSSFVRLTLQGRSSDMQGSDGAKSVNQRVSRPLSSRAKAQGGGVWLARPRVKAITLLAVCMRTQPDDDELELLDVTSTVYTFTYTQ